VGLGRARLLVCVGSSLVSLCSSFFGLVNLAVSLSMLKNELSVTGGRLRVGILDLDVFGPSVPTLMGLRDAPEPNLTEREVLITFLYSYVDIRLSEEAIIPLTNHGIPTMSMAYLLPRSSSSEEDHDKPIVWRGLMVQKAVQDLLFNVDWTEGGRLPELDVLVIDMPPGTGDVALTLGQLVKVDGEFLFNYEGASIEICVP
jgi:ATP-binding protein involved in chromosome partitioning